MASTDAVSPDAGPGRTVTTASHAAKPGPTLDTVRGTTFHGRRGAVANAFSYAVDYLLIDPAMTGPLPWLFSRNRGNLTSLHDADHGGPPRAGTGLVWVRQVLAARGLHAALAGGRVLLLAQPRVLGHVFNPVSFWLCHAADGSLRAVIAEVSNTFGDRHCYLCHHDDLRRIAPHDDLRAEKILHVSPFQPVAGAYSFRFDIRADRVAIRIDYDQQGTAPGERLIATLTGTRRPLTNRAILRAALVRPFGSRRVLGLIHWQALRLWLRGARYRPRPAPPVDEVTR